MNEDIEDLLKEPLILCNAEGRLVRRLYNRYCIWVTEGDIEKFAPKLENIGFKRDKNFLLLIAPDGKTIYDIEPNLEITNLVHRAIGECQGIGVLLRISFTDVELQNQP